MQFERARSGDKDQRKPTAWFNACSPERIFYRNLERGIRLKADKIRQKIPEKFYCMQSRNVHDFLTESVVHKEKQLDAISARQIEIYLIL